MRKVLKWAGILAGAAVLAVAAFGAWAVLRTRSKLGRRLEIPAPALAAKADVKRGERLARVRLGCLECHGDDFAGMKVVDEAPVGRIHGSNVTPALLKDWTDAETARAIRHGVARDGRPLVLMPSHDYQWLTQQDLSDLTAFLRGVPAVDKPNGPVSLGPVFTVLYALGKLPTLTPVDVIDHARPYPPQPKEAATPEFGEYLARTACMGCHGPALKGGPIPGGDPKWPPAAPITKDALGTYSEAEFIHLLRTGVTPTASKVRFPMIIRYTAQFTDTELKALWAYIQSLPSDLDF